MKPPQKRDALIVTASFTVILFAIVMGWVIWGGQSAVQGTRITAAPPAPQVIPVPMRGSWNEVERLWGQDSGAGDIVAAPPAGYALPDIPGGRRVWQKSAGGMESWGYVTEENARDVGLAVLDHYQSMDGWELGSSESLDMWGSAWGGTVFRRETQEVVSVVALPSRLGESPGGKENQTRVSVMRIAGKEALESVVSEQN